MTDDDPGHESGATDTHDPDGVPYPPEGAIRDLFARPVKADGILGDIGVAAAATKSAGPLVTKAKDREGHEHAADGKFTGPGGGGSAKPKPKPKPKPAPGKPAPAAPKKPAAKPAKPATDSAAPAPGGDNGGGELPPPTDPKKEYAPADVHAKVVGLARKKFAGVPRPTAEEVKKANEGCDKLGANKYRKTLVGNKYDREARRNKLLKEFGDGTRCPCLYCGVYVGHGTLEQDKILTTRQGGKYRVPNLVPSCSDCNKRRSDMTFADALDKAVKYGGDPT